MSAKNEWLGPKTADFSRSVAVLSIVAVVALAALEVDGRLGLGHQMPRLLHSILRWLAGLSLSLLLAALGIRVSFWIIDRKG